VPACDADSRGLKPRREMSVLSCYGENLGQVPNLMITRRMASKLLACDCPETVARRSQQFGREQRDEPSHECSPPS
jgi:hypothetical protein